MNSPNSASSDGAISTPPRFVDPRRLGTLIGLAGAWVFVFGYVDELGGPLVLVSKSARG